MPHQLGCQVHSVLGMGVKIVERNMTSREEIAKQFWKNKLDANQELFPEFRTPEFELNVHVGFTSYPL